MKSPGLHRHRRQIASLQSPTSPVINTTIHDQKGLDITSSFKTMVFRHQLPPVSPNGSLETAATNLTDKRRRFVLSTRQGLEPDVDYSEPHLMFRTIVGCGADDWPKLQFERSECDRNRSVQAYTMWCRPFIRTNKSLGRQGKSLLLSSCYSLLSSLLLATGTNSIAFNRLVFSSSGFCPCTDFFHTSDKDSVRIRFAQMLTEVSILGHLGAPQPKQGSCEPHETCINGPDRDRQGRVEVAWCIDREAFVELARDVTSGRAKNDNTKASQELPNAASMESGSSSEVTDFHRLGGGSEQGAQGLGDDLDLSGMTMSEVVSAADGVSPLQMQSLDVEAGVLGKDGKGLVGLGGSTAQEKSCENCVDLEMGQFSKGTAALRTEATVLTALSGVVWIALFAR